MFLEYLDLILHVSGTVVIGAAGVAAILVWVFGRVLPAWIAPGIILILGALFLWAGEVSDRRIAKLETQISTMKHESAKAEAQDERDARSASNVLASAASDTRNQTNVKVQATDNQYNSLLRRLRAAETRARTAEAKTRANTAYHGETPVGDHGAELPGSIGEEYVQEAKRGDTIRHHLLACYAQYDRAKAEVERFEQRSEASLVE